MSDRYQRLQVIGQGQSGVVHAGMDRLLGRPVAIKTMHRLGGQELYWLKREFRCLAEFSHRNFVELYDLVVSDSDCFFTMELVEGKDFLRRFRTPGPDPQIDYDALRSALAEVASGLSALHAQHKLHRDLKPHNALVEDGGRVVILDFDLVLDTRSATSLRESAMAGTPIYMSPEQLWGRPLSPASDWYSIGAMAFEVLTGEIPLTGERWSRAMQGDWNIPPASALAPATPHDLDELVGAMLRPAPRERAGAAEVLEALRTKSAGSRPRAASAATGPARPESHAYDGFEGREAELEILRSAFRDDTCARTVSIEGPAGIGKSTLVDHFAREAECDEQVLVLRGRSHPRELVPFKALDAAVDDLHRYIVHQPDEQRRALLEPNDGILARLFPVFLDLFPDTQLEAVQSREARQQAFTAMRNLVGRIAQTVRVVLWLDDLHWSDLDSIALLRELRREPTPPRLLTILSFRDGEPGSSDVLAAARDVQWGLEAESESVSIVMGPLSEHHARAVVRDRLHGSRLSDSDVDAVVANASGSPLLLVELARHSGIGRAHESAAPRSTQLEDIVADVLEDLPARARRLLEFVAVSSGPVPEELLFRFGGNPGTILPAITTLRSQLLVRRVMREQQPAIDVYHSRIRDSVLARIDSDRMRQLHIETIALLEQSRKPDAMLLVHHYFGAGDHARAGRFAFEAAERLAAALAPNAAAAMYRKAIDLGSDACAAWDLHARLGASLVQAGRGGEGARWLESAATQLLAIEPGNLSASRLQREAAEQYLRSGLHREGLEILRQVLTARGIFYPASSSTALASLVFHRCRAAIARRFPAGTAAARSSSDDREVLEAYWSAGVGLSLFDGIRAADFNARHAAWARRLGDVGHMARAAASEGMILAWEGGHRKRTRSRERLEQGRALAESCGNPNVLAHAILMQGASAYMEARWRDAIALASETEELCTRHCRGAAWELANAHVMTATSLACLGESRRLREHLPQVLSKAKERDDQYLLVTGRLGHAHTVWLMSDRPDDGRRQAYDALAGPFPPGFAWQVYQGALAIGQLELYVGAPETGWQHAARAVELMESQYMMRFMPTRVEMLDLRARCALAIATTSQGAARDAQLKFVERAARLIAAEDAPWVQPFASLLRAGLLSRTSHGEDSLLEYRNAAEGFDGLGMRMHAWAARFRSMELGAPQADSAARASEAWVREEGIVDPLRLARVFAP